MRSARSNTVTVWPARFSWSAAASPAGPEPTTATRLPVRCGRRLRATIQPSSNARSMIATSIALIVTGSSLMPSTHDAFARRRAQPAGELGKVVGRVQPLDRRPPAVAVDADRSSRESGCPADSPDGRTGCRSPCSARACRCSSLVRIRQVDLAPVVHRARRPAASAASAR